MKTFFILLLLISSFTHADSEFDSDLNSDLSLPGWEEAGIGSEFDEIDYVSAAEKRNFIARTMYPSGGWQLVLRIETNFKVPLMGSQTYFGKIFFKQGENHIRYRDELIANDNYRDESVNPSHYNTSVFSFANMNKPNGNSVATGVRLIGQNLNGNTGGRLTIAVKPPGSARMNIPIDIQVSRGRTVNSVTANGRRIVFDSIKINAENQSILSGLENVQFFQNGRLVHTMDAN